MITRDALCACGHLIAKHDESDQLRCYAKVGPRIDDYCPCFHFDEEVLQLSTRKSQFKKLGLLSDLDDWVDRPRVFTEDDYCKGLPVDAEWELRRAIQAAASRAASDEWCAGVRSGAISAAS